MKTIEELENMGAAIIARLKLVNEAYKRVNFNLMALEIRMKEDADKNRLVGNMFNKSKTVVDR